MMKMTRLLFALGLLTMLGACVPEKKDPDVAQKEEELIVAVEGIQISKKRLINAIEGSGLIAGINEAYVISETRGIIQEVNFELGDYVKKGAVLVTVDPRLAKLNLDQANQQWDTAKFDLSASQKLYKSGNETLARLNQVKSAEIISRVQVELAEKAYQDSFIKAPISGYIAEKVKEITVGNYLNTNARVTRIVDLSSLRMEVAFGEGQIGYIKEGSSARIKVAATCRDEEFTGRVTAIAAGSDQQTGSFITVVTWQNSCKSGDLKSGMTGSVSIDVDSLPETIIIPNSAIREKEGARYVFIVNDGVAVQRQITTGNRLGQRVEVTSGLNVGDVLITSGFFQFSDGNKVNVLITE